MTCVALGVFAGGVAVAGQPVPSDEKISPGLLEELRSGTYEAGTRIPIIVRVDADFFEEQRQRWNSIGRRPMNMMRAVQAFNTALSATQIEWLSRSDLVEYITLDAPLTAYGKGGNRPTKSGDPVAETDPVTNPTVENTVLQTLGVDQLVGLDGSGVNVAVFDPGVCSHPDLNGVHLVSVDFTSGQAVLGSEDGTFNGDPCGHGTHVVGLIAGNGFKSEGPIVEWRRVCKSSTSRSSKRTAAA